ncbi:MAG: SMI1/KNR4 family protein [Actinoplanes sp.]
MVLPDWHRLLTTADGYQARTPASAEALAAQEELLQAIFPFQLSELYLVSDGVYDQRGQWYVVWPLAELHRRNELDWANDAAGRRDLVAFGDDGTGATFCVPRDGGSGVFSWNKLAAAPYWLANDVGDFWIGWTTGTITT